MSFRLRSSSAFDAAVFRWLGLRLGLALVAAALAVGALRAATAAEMSPEERQQIESVVRDYLLKNPDVLLEALQGAKDKMESDAREKAVKALTDHHAEIFDDPATPVGGNPQGDVSLVEFFDYRCPYCKQVEPSLEKLLAEDHGLRFVYKELPVLGPDSVTAARAALAAVKQGKYAAFHTAMMAAKGQINDTVIYGVADEAGLDVQRLKTDMAAPEVDKALKANLDLADLLDIRGTPGFVIGKEIIPGAVDIATLRQYIATARNAK